MVACGVHKIDVEPISTIVMQNGGSRVIGVGRESRTKVKFWSCTSWICWSKRIFIRMAMYAVLFVWRRAMLLICFDFRVFDADNQFG